MYVWPNGLKLWPYTAFLDAENQSVTLMKRTTHNLDEPDLAASLLLIDDGKQSQTWEMAELEAYPASEDRKTALALLISPVGWVSSREVVASSRLGLETGVSAVCNKHDIVFSET